MFVGSVKVSDSVCVGSLSCTAPPGAFGIGSTASGVRGAGSDVSVG